MEMEKHHKIYWRGEAYALIPLIRIITRVAARFLEDASSTRINKDVVAREEAELLQVHHVGRRRRLEATL